MYACEFPSYFDAFVRERQVKKWSRKKKEALFRDDFEALVRLSKSKRSQIATIQSLAILRRAQDGSVRQLRMGLLP